MGERCACNVWHFFEAQCIHEYDSDGGFVFDKWNPRHLMVGTYSHLNEVNEVVISSVCFNTFTCTLDDILAFTSIDSGVVLLSVNYPTCIKC